MLTPVDVQNKVFKGGIGYDKRDIEVFMNELSSDYAQLYRSNIELTDKVATLNESLQHYRSIEDSMRKALTLSKKTAEETVNAANDKARQISIEAEIKAEAILAEAKVELQETKDDIYRLQQQYIVFKKQFTKILKTQLKLMDNEVVDIDLGFDFEPNPYSNNMGGGFSSFGLGGGGGYAGSFSDGRERTNQDPTIDRGPLNMDPFADAMKGGGRFSKQYGSSSGSYSNKDRSTSSSGNSTGKSSLNVKTPTERNTRVRRNFTNIPPNPNYNNDTTITQSAPKPVPETQKTAAFQSEPQRTESQRTEPQRMEPRRPEPANNVRSSTTPSGQTSQQNAFKTNTSVTGEVETKAKESNMLDSEDNHASGFDFINELMGENIMPTTETVANNDDNTVVGEVEDKVNESNMLDSEDNYGNEFDFISEDANNRQNSIFEDSSTDDSAYSGEVEDKIKESNMLDSEDNYGDGFDFVSEDSGSATNSSSQHEADNIMDDDTYVGEVEDKVNEATMLDSEDNYNDGFDFVSEDTSQDASQLNNTVSSDDDIYAGEVEDRVNESIMLDSEDNYNDGFDFVVNNTNDEEEIPTISSLNSFDNSDEDVFVGDVEDIINKSTLIGNADDEDEGFNFL